MIEINLLPDGLRRKTEARKVELAPGVNRFLYIVPLIFVLLITAHIFLFIAIFFMSRQLSSMNNKWLGLEPQRKMIEEVNNNLSMLSEENRLIQQLMDQRINWSQKLNELSTNLPPRIWFNQISFSGKRFVLDGSLVPLSKDEMNLIKEFMDNLKKDKDFMSDFTSFQLGSMQSRSVSELKISDFTLEGALKK